VIRATRSTDALASATHREDSKMPLARPLNLLATLALALVGALLIAAPASAVPFEIISFDGNALQSNGDPATQAASHPATASTTFSFSTVTAADGSRLPAEELKDAVVDLPPGLVGNPQAVAQCTDEELSPHSQSHPGTLCPVGSQVGGITLWEDGRPSGNVERISASLFNMTAPKGTPARLGFVVANATFHIVAKLRTGGDYGVTVMSRNAPGTVPFERVDVEVWGVPADPSHDKDRGQGAGGTDCYVVSEPKAGEPHRFACENPDPLPPVPFFTLPTACEGPVTTTLTATSWTGSSDTKSFLSHDNSTPIPNPIGADGCSAVHFSPTLEARPATSAADSPTGLDVKLHIPQNNAPLPIIPPANPNDPEELPTLDYSHSPLAEAHLHKAVVTLPEGLVVNPSGANGLGACSSSQIDLHSEGPAHCPDASKVGRVDVETPLLDHPLSGAVYVATPHDNPFDSLLAIYIVVEDPQTGVIVKLAGQVEPDPVTGRLKTTFADNPQLPFEDFLLHFFGGATAALRTPAVCGKYSTTSELTPWSAPESGPPAEPLDDFAINQGPGGSGCATSPLARPNAPSFEAGTVSPLGGAYTPFVISLRREDGSQEFSALTVKPPPGLVGKLAGIPYCPESALVAAAAKSGREEQASPSCPAASQVGTVSVGAGAGPAPYYAGGKAYLTGPYKGAPLSLAIVTPATAGPFDLGTVVVRTALYVDPETAQITAVSDPIPHILQGIVLDVRSVVVKVDRPEFTLNPTSCNPMAIGGQLVSTLNQAATLAGRFQAAECGRLKFAPKLSLRLRGKTGRGGHPALRAALRMPAGGANIAGASVALPHSEFLDQAHIRTICTRVQFAVNACPAGAVYGRARALSPLLDHPLEGPVYLRSSDNPLPDLVADLNGQIHIVLDGRIDSVRGGIRNTFETVPDAPVSKFVLEMQGGAKGLLVNSRNICRQANRAVVQFDAQNGKIADSRPALKAQCGKKPRRGKHLRR
jgi:hypothetical protein